MAGKTCFMLDNSDYMALDAIELAEGIRNKNFLSQEANSCAAE